MFGIVLNSIIIGVSLCSGNQISWIYQVFQRNAIIGDQYKVSTFTGTLLQVRNKNALSTWTVSKCLKNDRSCSMLNSNNLSFIVFWTRLWNKSFLLYHKNIVTNIWLSLRFSWCTSWECYYEIWKQQCIFASNCKFSFSVLSFSLIFLCYFIYWI